MDVAAVDPRYAVGIGQATATYPGASYYPAATQMQGQNRAISISSGPSELAGPTRLDRSFDPDGKWITLANHFVSPVTKTHPDGTIPLFRTSTAGSNPRTVFCGAASVSSAIADIDWRLGPDVSVGLSKDLVTEIQAFESSMQPIRHQPPSTSTRDLPDEMEVKRLSAVFLETLWPM